MELYNVIKEPIITEKSMALKEKENKYVFACDLRANKIEIANAVEKFFNVKVVSVATSTVKPRAKRVGQYAGYTSAYKKAIVKLAEGNKIAAFEI
jgi:large subunit ribosomal protein L23